MRLICRKIQHGRQHKLTGKLENAHPFRFSLFLEIFSRLNALRNQIEKELCRRNYQFLSCARQFEPVHFGLVNVTADLVDHEKPDTQKIQHGRQHKLTGKRKTYRNLSQALGTDSILSESRCSLERAGKCIHRVFTFLERFFVLPERRALRNDTIPVESRENQAECTY